MGNLDQGRLHGFPLVQRSTALLRYPLLRHCTLRVDQEHLILHTYIKMAQQDLGHDSVSASTAARQHGNEFYKIKDFEKVMASYSSRSIPQITN